MTKRYLFGGGVDKPLVSYNNANIASSNRLFLHSNHQGSIIAASNASGTGVYINTYDAFGNPRTTNQGRFSYTGQTYLSELGMYYYKGRMYMPSLGRFAQTDPVGYKDQMDLYSYVGNDPVNNADPTGMITDCNSSECITSADTFDPAKSNGQTSVADSKMEAAAQKAIPTVAVTSGTKESVAFGVKDESGNVNVNMAAGARTGTTKTADTTRAAIPDGTVFVEHGHIDGRSGGMVDDPKSNGGYGDTQPLATRNHIPNATVSNGQVGWHEIRGGQLTFRAPIGALTVKELHQIQTNLNKSQKKFQSE